MVARLPLAAMAQQQRLSCPHFSCCCMTGDARSSPCKKGSALDEEIRLARAIFNLVHALCFAAAGRVAPRFVHRRSDQGENINDKNRLRAADVQRERVRPCRHPGPPALPADEHLEKGDEMNLKMIAATAALAAMALGGCGQGKDYRKVRYEHNPDPKERYEITVTVQGAPGPMDFAEGGAWYDIANRTCLPRKDPYTGADVVADSAGREMVLQPGGSGTWTATVYADGMREAPYFGTEVCTWTFGGVGSQVKATGAHEETRFMPSMNAEQILREETVVTYFNKLMYPRVPSIENYPDLGTTNRSRFGPPLTDADLFTITMRSRKVAP
ncbi:MAG: hypothetical protein JSS56_17020 [Proteobacteria bacterium]|nr:hypothetical protein [Pseudomonadota bacterium]